MAQTLSKEDSQVIAARGLQDPRFFCKFFLADWFPGRMSWVHVGILAILTKQTKFLELFDEEYLPRDLDKILRHFVYPEDPTDPASPILPVFVRGADGLSLALGKYTLIMMPRGASKTTLANAVSVYNTVYLAHKFFLYLSEAGPHAEAQITTVGRMLTGNQKLLAVFGNVRPEQRNTESLRWSESEGMLQTTTGVTFIARGRGAQIRGLLINGKRPDLIVFDDIEDRESVKTYAQRVKVAEWLFGDVMPALPELDPHASMVGLGTMLGPEAVLETLAKDPNWTVVRFGVLDDDGEPIWPEWMDEAKIESKKRSFATKNLLHLFYMEYFNKIRGAESGVFPQITIAPSKLEEYIYRAMAIDPAISPKRRADSCVISVVGMKASGMIGVLDVWGKRGALPREQVDQYFRLHLMYMPRKHGVESVAYQAALIHLLREEMFRKGRELKRLGRNPSDAYFDIQPITHSGDKTQRIEGILQPRYASGYIVHQHSFPILETQLKDWPNGKRDYPDAVAMAVSLLDDAAPMAGGDTVSDDLEPLEQVFGGDWRSW